MNLMGVSYYLQAYQDQACEQEGMSGMVQLPSFF